MINVTVPDTAQLERDLGVARQKMLADLKAEITKVTIDVLATVKDKKLSGQVLKVQSGRLRRSINQRVTTTDTGVEGLVGTNVEYARVHEFGFNGVVNVKEHMRRTKAGFAKVRSFNRHMNMPERSFMRSSLDEMRSGIDSRIAAVIGKSIASVGKGAA